MSPKKTVPTIVADKTLNELGVDKRHPIHINSPRDETNWRGGGDGYGGVYKKPDGRYITAINPIEKPRGGSVTTLVYDDESKREVESAIRRVKQRLRF
jgi:hypothetical protein